MKITNKGFFTIREAMGRVGPLEMEVDKATVREVLVGLSNRYGEKFMQEVFDPETKDIRGQNQILINGRHYRYFPARLDTELHDGDVLAIFPPVAGG